MLTLAIILTIALVLIHLWRFIYDFNGHFDCDCPTITCKHDDDEEHDDEFFYRHPIVDFFMFIAGLIRFIKIRR